MTHTDAVRIANGGQGAVVSELLRLSGKLEEAEAHVKILQADVATYGDRAALVPGLLSALKLIGTRMGYVSNEGVDECSQVARDAIDRAGGK